MRWGRLAILGLAVLICALAVGSLASARGAAATIFFTKSTPRKGTGQLWTVKANGAKPRMLRTGMPVGPEGAVATPSRDASRVFCICKPGEIDSVDAHGRDLRRIGPQPAKTRYDVVTLSSTGRAFWVKRFNRIWSQKGAGPKRLVTWAKGAVVDERVVPNPAGNKIAFVRYGCLGPTCPPGEAVQIRTMSIDGGGTKTIYRSSDERREIYELSWSLDGTQLIFHSATPPEKEPVLPVESEYIVVGGDGSDPVYRGSCRWPICEFAPRAIGWTSAPPLGRLGRRGDDDEGLLLPVSPSGKAQMTSVLADRQGSGG